jgi:flagellin-specific chaperone FliS
MSFTKILYELIIPKEITINPFTDIPKAIDFIRDLTGRKFLTVIEKHEFEKFQMLAQRIEEKADLLPMLNQLLDGKKGGEIKESLLQHRTLVHSLYYNKKHVLDQVDKIIDELERQVMMEEKWTKSGYKVVKEPQVNNLLARRN